MSVVNYKCPMCNSFPLETSEVCHLKCNHSFCWKCMERYVCDNLKPKVKCPNNGCFTFINDSIIRKILPENMIEEYEDLCIPKNNDQIFHCLLPDCNKPVFYDSKSIQFECESCSLFNCIRCEATHPRLTCDTYQKKKNKVNNKSCQEELRLMKEAEMRRALSIFNNAKYKTWSDDIRALNTFELVPNHELFECSICSKIVPKGDGVKLRQCFDLFCRSCFHDSVKNSENIPINCPAAGCLGKLEDREIRGILTDDEYRIYSLKCNEMVKGKIENIFHCKKPDCAFFGIVDSKKYDKFECPACKSENCLKCNIIHKRGETCKEYQDDIHYADNPDFRNLAYIEAEIKSGKCMKCPTCGSLIKKAGGCNWLKCPQCKLEICWILKIPRWGPKGNGDISGGCRCGVNKKTCDPRCLVGCIPEH